MVGLKLNHVSKRGPCPLIFKRILFMCERAVVSNSNGCLHYSDVRMSKHDGESNQQRFDCLSNRLFWRRSEKTSKLRVTGLREGNSPVTDEFPAQRVSNAESVSIWWRHHVVRQLCLGVSRLHVVLALGEVWTGIHVLGVMAIHSIYKIRILSEGNVNINIDTQKKLWQNKILSRISYKLHVGTLSKRNTLVLHMYWEDVPKIFSHESTWLLCISIMVRSRNLSFLKVVFVKNWFQSSLHIRVHRTFVTAEVKYRCNKISVFNITTKWKRMLRSHNESCAKMSLVKTWPPVFVALWDGNGWASFTYMRELESTNAASQVQYASHQFIWRKMIREYELCGICDIVNKILAMEYWLSITLVTS